MPPIRRGAEFEQSEVKFGREEGMNQLLRAKGEFLPGAMTDSAYRGGSDVSQSKERSPVSTVKEVVKLG